MNDALTLLRDAKALIASPKSWCQGHAKQTTMPGMLIKRDLLTAILDAGTIGKYSSDAITEVLNAVYEETGRFGITVYNDSPHTTHAHIYALVERAEGRLK